MVGGGTALVYFLSVRVGLALLIPPQIIAPVWPASGLALALLVLGGRRAWPELLAVIVGAESLARLMTGQELTTSLGFACLDGLESWLAAWLLLYYCSAPRIFTRVREVLGLVGLVLVSAASTAVLGIGLMGLHTGLWSWEMWEPWWMAHSAGTLLVAPVVLLWAVTDPREYLALSRWRGVEFVGLLAALAGLALLVFRADQDGQRLPFTSYQYAALLGLIWLTFRFGPYGVTTATLVRSVVAVWYTFAGHGPYAGAGQTPAESLLAVQVFLAVSQCFFLLLAAVIAERQQAEAAIASERRLLRTLIDTLPDRIYMKDAAGRYIITNAANLQWLGASTLENVIGKTVFDFFPAPLASLYDADDQQVLQSGQPIFDREGPLLESAGQQYSYWTTKVPLRDSHGTIIGVVGVSRDMTEYKRTTAALQESQERLAAMNTALEQRVAERTAELQAINQELEAFSYSVSHDLRAPLRHIAGFVHMLQQHEGERLDATSRHYVQIIAEATHKMGQLIDDLLAFSRSGRGELRTRPVSLDTLVRDVQQELVLALQQRCIVWEVGPLPVVQGDPALLRLVWTNLLSNALKYTTPRSEARIAIGTLPGAPGETVLFVRDNGVGFDMRYVDKLFGVFQRLHRDDEFPGTGIGLAIVRRIVHRHGGRVWAEGAVGSGATFYFTLRTSPGDTPAADCEDAPGAGPREPDSAPQAKQRVTCSSSPSNQ
jgi:PAS domain S-box-containing protein